MREERREQARILVVDDEPQNVRYVADVLKWAGFRHVTGVSDSVEAVSRFRELAPDLVILDLLMPQMDGFDVLDALQSELSHDEYLPVLVLTSDVTGESRRRALAGGAKDFLTKPMSPTEVRLRVENLLETRFLYLELAKQTAASGRTAGPTPGEPTSSREDELLEVWGAALDHGLHASPGHAKRVAWLSGRLARDLGLPDEEADLIGKAALIYRMGARPARSYPLVSEASSETRPPIDAEGTLRLLDNVTSPVLEKVREVVSGVATRWDSGMPGVARGSGAPTAGRIVAVASEFDALCHGPEPLQPDAAIEAIEAESGTRFDPAVVAALTRTQAVGSER